MAAISSDFVRLEYWALYGNGKAVYRKAIEHTDFPLPEITLYFTNKLILLPSEN
jgi:hypothetical protein